MNHPRFTFAAGLFGIIALATMLVGCESSQPVTMFQSNLEQYVSKQGHGDLNVLRETPGASNQPRPTFGAIHNSSEVQGVLLGTQQALGRAWYLYLVGTTRDRDVTDIRMMAVSRNPAAPKEDYDWITGPGDRTATAQYRTARLESWRKSHPQAAKDNGFEMTFPLPDDEFTLSSSGSIATAADDRSGAKWTLEFAEKPSKKSATRK